MSSQSNSRQNRTGNVKHILIVGETGVGKSSTFNLVLGRDAAAIGDSCLGVTQEIQWFQAREEGENSYKFYDSPGLSEGAYGTAPGFLPKELLETVVTQRSAAAGEGISAFLMIIKEVRITQAVTNCYSYLHNLRRKDAGAVPIIAVLTHIDHDNGAERVRDYQATSRKFGMEFTAIIPACTADLERFELSQHERILKRKKNTLDLIFEALAEHAVTPGWKPKGSLLSSAYVRVALGTIAAIVGFVAAKNFI